MALVLLELLNQSLWNLVYMCRDNWGDLSGIHHKSFPLATPALQPSNLEGVPLILAECTDRCSWNFVRLSCHIPKDRLCGLVVRVPGYRSRGPRFDSRSYQIFWEVVSRERGPLSYVSTVEEILGRNSSGSGLENREYGRWDRLRWPRDTIYPQNLALT
jgi:hypothetical protein